MPDGGRVAFVTGGGRGIGANVAHALAADGFDVVVAARSRGEVEAVAEKIGGRAIQLDVTDREAVERAVAEAGAVELLFANAGVAVWEEKAWEVPVDEWWRVLEVNLLGVHLCCRAVIPGMLERGGGRIVITSSGAAYLPGGTNSAYSASKAAVSRYGEVLARQLEGQIAVFHISPGLVKTELTVGSFPDDAPWTPDECAPNLVRKLATGRYDALAGRYVHAEHDDVDDLLARIDELREQDLNTIRLRR